MEPRTLQYLTDAMAGRCLSGWPETVIQRVCTDSREVQARDLFVALEGTQFDGHAFLQDAIGKGIIGAVVARPKVPAPLPNCAMIAVENTRAAYGRLAGRYRRDFPLPIIAVGGSNGKTTTKELISAVVRQKFRTLSSPASFNNDIGVPATLLQLSREHEVAVLEFGTNHPGELAPLLRLAGPQIAVITSIGREHLEFFGDLAGVIEEEGWLAESLPADGRLFINGESPGVDEIARRSRAPVVRVGFGPDHDWRALDVRMDQTGLVFTVETARPGFAREFRVPLLGRHQALNALLAIGVGETLGLSAEEVQRGLRQCAPAKMRLQVSKWGEVELLDDSYNANADSMRAALDTLRDFPCHGRRAAVLGEMAELGASAAKAHAEIGQYAAQAGVQRLFVVGAMASVMAGAARQAGLTAVDEFSDLENVVEAVREYLRPGDVLLLKASRKSGLERIGDQLRQASKNLSNNDTGQGLNYLGKG
jgi:UDP-N-acetylmuramoyl-tripeptide--D-alanyl-D-alanine ligase